MDQWMYHPFDPDGKHGSFVSRKQFLAKSQIDEDQNQGTPTRSFLYRWLGITAQFRTCLSCQQPSITSMEGLQPIHLPI
jgi:hypothetical protein